MRVTLDGDGSREAGEREGSIDLRQCSDEELLNVAASGEEAGDAEDDENSPGDGEVLERPSRTSRTRVVAGGGSPGENCGLRRWIRDAHRYGEA